MTLADDGTIANVDVKGTDSDMDASFLAMCQNDAFLNQFAGKIAPIDENIIDIVAGATISSKAIISAVNSVCIDAYKNNPNNTEEARNAYFGTWELAKILFLEMDATSKYLSSHKISNITFEFSANEVKMLTDYTESASLSDKTEINEWYILPNGNITVGNLINVPLQQHDGYLVADNLFYQYYWQKDNGTDSIQR